MKTMTRTVMGAAIGSAFACAWANPTGPTLVNGAALISNPSASVMQVVNTPGTILNWQGFSIGVGETTRFVQQNAASAVLNRVVTANPSNILGRLDSNGRVFLVNPNGIVFGGGAVVDVAGLIASTRDISNANFLAGNYLFNGTGNGNITLQSGAQILTSTYGPGGQVWLFAKNITQEAGSTITAPQGQVVLAAGSQLQVATNNLGNMTFAVDTSTGDTVQALGDIVAQRGAVGFFADQITIAGRVSARSDANGAGTIVASAGTDLTVANGGLLDVSADGANSRAGTITLEATRTLKVEPGAEVLAESLQGTGGSIQLKGNEVSLPMRMFEYVADASQNVRAYGKDQASDGTVTVTETGTFSYSLSASPLTQETIAFTSFNNDPCFFCTPHTYVRLALQAGDGAILVARETYDPLTRVITERFEILRNGQRTDLGVLYTSTYGPIDDRQARGLTRGGWALLDRETKDPSGNLIAGYALRIINPAGQVKPTIDLTGTTDWRIVPLPSGAVKLVSLYDDNSYRVYSAEGTELTGADRAAALGTVRPMDSARIASASATGPVLGFFSWSHERVEDVADNRNSTTTEKLRLALYRNGQNLALLPESVWVDSWHHDNSPPSLYYPVTISESDTQYFTRGFSSNFSMGGRELVVLKETSIRNQTRLSTGATETRDITSQVDLFTRTPTNTSAASTAAGSVGASAGFATRQGEANDGAPLIVNPNPPPAPPPPAPVVSGRAGGGATFGGVSGCNSAVCATEVRSALAQTDAVRASQNVTREGRIDDTQAAEAVAALARAQQGGRTTADNDREGLAVMRDYGELERLTADITQSLGSMTPDRAAEQAQLLNGIIRDFMERELSMQQLGLYRTDPNAMDLVSALQNMNAEERAAFGSAIRDSQARGEAPR